MKKHGLWIVVILIFAGMILGTLGTWSVPLGYGISAFWPAFVVQASGGIWFGGWGVLAAVLFPILTNALTNVGWSGILGFIPANLAQGLIPAWAFRYFRADPAIPGRKGLVFFAIWGALIPAVVGGLIGSVAVILFGKTLWSEYPLLVVKWAVPNMVVSFLIGVPVMRELTPLLRNLDMLVKGWWTFEQAGSQASSWHFQDIPIQLKLMLAMSGAGLGPLLLLSLLELVRNGGNSATGSMTPLFLTISLVASVFAVGFLSRATVRPLQELKEQVEALVQYRDGEFTIKRTDEIGQLGQAFAFLLNDWRRADASLQESEEKYRTLVESLNVGIFQSTLNGTFLHANSAVIHLAGYDNWEEIKEMPTSNLYADAADRERLIAELMTHGRVRNVEVRSVKKDGTIYWISISAILLKDMEGKPASILGSIVDITERRQAEEALRENEAIFSSFMEYSPVYIFFKDKEIRTLRLSRNYEQMLGMPISQMLGKTMAELFPSDLAKAMVEDDLRILNQGQRVDIVEEFNGHIYETTKFPIFKDGKPNMLAGFTMDVTERRRAEEALRESEEHFHSLYDNATIGMYRTTPDGHILLANPAGVSMLGYDSFEEIAKRNLEDEGFEPNYERSQFHEKMKREGIVVGLESAWKRKDGSTIYVRESATAIKDGDGNIIYYDGTFEDITERKRAEEHIQNQLERLNALRKIDDTIKSSDDLRFTLKIFLGEVAAQLKVDAASVLLFNKTTLTLDHAASYGFASSALQHTKLESGQGYAGSVILDRKTIHIPDLTKTENKLTQALSLAGENFTAYVGSPLIAKGQVVGVLEIFQRKPFAPTPEWFNFLNMLVSQAAIAIDNAQLFENLQRSNFDLTLAYDATIEAWSRVLDLRDKETEGHTQRVTSLTVKLAQQMGIPHAEIVHIRRGALLHDIGKMGVPDNILHKPDKLTPEEWDIMRQHTIYAYEMLLPIHYLKPALDIPQYHHEKWDGTGYPHGLKGGEIPLAARIFAVVDVWDAVTSDRPYRSGWTKEKAIKHIKSESGKHFDPKVVKTFLSLIG